MLAYVLCEGLWALLVHGVYRGLRGTWGALVVVGALGIVDLVVQLVRDVATRSFVHGAFFLAALVLSAAGYVLLLRRR